MNDIERLKRLRDKRNLSYREIAAALGVSLWTVFRWLNDRHSPSPMAASRISDYLTIAADITKGRKT